MPDSTIIVAFMTLIGTIFNGFVILKMRRVADETHTLVNSNTGAQLIVTSMLADRVAELTKKPIDIAAANEATKRVDNHDLAQKIVDSKK